MNKADLEKLNVKDLQGLIALAQKVLDKKLKKAEADFFKRMKAEAKALGIDMPAAETAPAPAKRGPKPKKAAAKKTTRAPVKPKYANPENPDDTWTGRGRAPLWAKPYKDEGRLDEIAI